ncbi:MAG: chitin deacetylase [Planctomycetes bacterium]|nr:chitin deacetylase [Planctomycetota bacterium]
MIEAALIGAAQFLTIPGGIPTGRTTSAAPPRPRSLTNAHSVPAGKASAAHARIAITLDLEMSAQYPRREMTEWNFEKGNLDEPTKQYSLQAARVAKELGGKIHFFCVGRVLEQPNVDWLKEIAAAGHPVGNHTYDHIHLKAPTVTELQFRFQRAPWLVEGRAARDVIRENIRVTNEALRSRVGIAANGFRTPGGFQNGLDDRVDLQELLLELGFRWVSSKYPAHPMGPPKTAPTQEIYDGIVAAQAQAQPYRYANGLVELPMSPVSDVGAFRTNYWKLEYFLKAIRLAVNWAIENRAVFTLLAHPSCLVVEDPQFESIRLICELVRNSADRARIVGLDELAAEWLA